MDVSMTRTMERINVPQTPGQISAGDAAHVLPIVQGHQTILESVHEATQKDKEVLKNKKNLRPEDLATVSQELNKFMEYLNADLQFQVHEKTNQLMVRLVDLKENKVLREFPSKEFLDMVANISEYIGMIIDKKI